MITPTIGRKVWYYPSDADMAGNFGMRRGPEQPLDATIIGVWAERHVNLQVIDLNGRAFFIGSATLVQPDEKAPCMDGREHGYAMWMPFQVHQAGQQRRMSGPSDSDANIVAGEMVLSLKEGGTVGTIEQPPEPVVVERIHNFTTGGVTERMSDGTTRRRSVVDLLRDGLPFRLGESISRPVDLCRQSDIIKN